MKKYLFIISFLFILIPKGFCAEISLPEYSRYVNDYAGILKEDTKFKLTALIVEIETKTQSQVAILTIDTTQPLDIVSYAVELFKKWGIGQKGKNNGVLLLVAVKDRALRIEVGYGLEGAIPDALAKNIIEAQITPFFKKGDYDAGIIAGTAAISRLIAKEYNVEFSEWTNLPQNISSGKEENKFFTFLFMFVMIIIITSLRTGFFLPLIFLSSSYRRRDDGFWGVGSSGGFSGGFGGFGGGSSGGGGASGS
jgi:uncharacterized protein